MIFFLVLPSQFFTLLVKEVISKYHQYFTMMCYSCFSALSTEYPPFVLQSASLKCTVLVNDYHSLSFPSQKAVSWEMPPQVSKSLVHYRWQYFISLTLFLLSFPAFTTLPLITITSGTIGKEILMLLPR